MSKLKKEFKEIIPFTIISKGIKYPGINLAKEVKDFYTKNDNNIELLHDPAVPFPDLYPRIWKTSTQTRYLYTNVHNSTIYNRQKLEKNLPVHQ